MRRLAASNDKNMKITTKHKASKFGVPVILNDAGDVMPTHEGYIMVKEKLKLTYHVIAFYCGVSARTAEGWASSSRTIPAAALVVLAELLEKKEETK